MEKKVDFIGIGPGKSGTTWLFLNLKKHPSICASKVKETNYFNEHYFRGEAWYHSLFNLSGESIVGEISNTYIFSPEAAARIHEYNSDIKLISILRDPIERAVSHYFFLIRNGASFSCFSDALKERPDILDRGLYFKHLTPYFRFFRDEQFFISTFDNLKSDSQRFSDELLGFLGVECITVTASGNEKLGSSRPKSRFLAKFVKYIAVSVRRIGYPILVERVKRVRLAASLYTKINYDVSEVVGDELEKLLEYFREDVEECSRLLGIDLVGLWIKKYSPGNGDNSSGKNLCE